MRSAPASVACGLLLRFAKYVDFGMDVCEPVGIVDGTVDYILASCVFEKHWRVGKGKTGRSVSRTLGWQSHSEAHVADVDF